MDSEMDRCIGEMGLVEVVSLSVYISCTLPNTAYKYLKVQWFSSFIFRI